MCGNNDCMSCKITVKSIYFIRQYHQGKNVNIFHLLINNLRLLVLLMLERTSYPKNRLSLILNHSESKKKRLMRSKVKMMI